MMENGHRAGQGNVVEVSFDFGELTVVQLDVQVVEKVFQTSGIVCRGSTPRPNLNGVLHTRVTSSLEFFTKLKIPIVLLLVTNANVRFKRYRKFHKNNKDSATINGNHVRSPSGTCSVIQKFIR